MTLLLDEEIDEKLEMIALVRAAQTGDRDAFGQLVERFERTVLALGLRMLGDYAEAQELCQEVFVQALRKIGQLRTPESFAGWLRSITKRMAINRKLRRGPTVSAEPEVLEATCVEHETPLDLTLRHERATQVRAGLRRLRSLDRKTLVAFYVRGQSLVEMSDEFDSPVGTIKRRLHVARKRLAKELEEMAPV
ncbi:MAG: RNA polymerase sigma factor [Pirellulales bacterium]